ncbi:hemerythrin domain-containing protein [Geobacillus thermoleovorans]|uniref:Hemerythrin-like domain-containing protein n=1 Tax=Geobacillus thermopakistaniensis (strain MAS1) TaxID=1408282 RepID=A0A7U9JBR6_GEOTM|nr:MULTISPECIES: hemerythrin domain-containing protein [Geobacillus]ESU72594.1 hypothetical protein T260_07215 [Geobacillus sp. MAS1]OQP20432.1 hypothetical protein B1694_13520 [Geobacillus zalihae]PJW13219.1 hypothetical protein CV945_15325 [Geobacillus sp. Manikaran-105]TRY36476.1 hemerythrin domain-containing protein [Geobacillus sp. LEMMJ02]UPT58611.1 hemerythrin domain-containing protein [Geobacillus thermoleovorans]
MSGPSLRKLEAHRSIHHGAFAEAKRLTELLETLYTDGRCEHAAEVADALVEHWETRIIAHAEAEEEGFYREKAKERGELAETITQLKRDHDMMRTLIAEIRQRLPGQIDREVLTRFHTLLHINRIHSTDEEALLF